MRSGKHERDFSTLSQSFWQTRCRRSAFQWAFAISRFFNIHNSSHVSSFPSFIIHAISHGLASFPSGSPLVLPTYNFFFFHFFKFCYRKLGIHLFFKQPSCKNEILKYNKWVFWLEINELRNISFIVIYYNSRRQKM